MNDRRDWIKNYKRINNKHESGREIRDTNHVILNSKYEIRDTNNVRRGLKHAIKLG